jgi:hypothetical protein
MVEMRFLLDEKKHFTSACPHCARRAGAPCRCGKVALDDLR